VFQHIEPFTEDVVYLKPADVLAMADFLRDAEVKSSGN
jgi:hypothetical protein